MKKIIVLKGLPGSGKSLYARKIINENPSVYKRVNKDELRLMLDDGKWSGVNEKFVLKVRDFIITQAITDGFYVIVDDTNLHPKHELHIKEIIGNDAQLEIVDMTNVPLDVCIKRDLKRPNSVGERVIKKMYRSYLQKKALPIQIDKSLPSAIMCDLDGTLAIMQDRNPYDASTCEQDLPNEPIIEIVNKFVKDYEFLFISGREDQHREQTEHWLNKYIKNPKQDMHLFMRKTGDHRKDAIVKKEIYEEQIKGKYNIKFILDDRTQVVEMWRSLGLTVLQVAEGDF